MEKKLIVFIIDESTNKIILSNNFSNVDVKYVLINYNNKDKPLIKSCKYSNVSIQNENKDSFEIFLNTNQPKLIYLTIPKLTNIVENYINSSNKDIFIFSNQSLQIKNNNCILSKSMKIDKFLSFAFENLGNKIDNPIVVKPLLDKPLKEKPLKEAVLEVKPLKDAALENKLIEKRDNKNIEKLYQFLLEKFILNKINIKIDNIELPQKEFLFYNEDKNYTPIIGIDSDKINSEDIIPKKIYKVFVNDTIDKLPKGIMINAINIWKEFYPDYELVIYDSEKINDFYLEHYGVEFIYIYNMIIPNAFKCDFFRYCLLYKFGGVYSDLKQVPIEKIDIEKYQFVAAYEKHLDWDKMLGLDFIPCQNCFIACIKEHPYMKGAIDMCIQNVLKNRYNSFCTDATGPVMLGRCIKYIRKNMFIDNEKELFYYFYEYKNKNSTEYYINETNSISGRRIIKHKYDNTNGADWSTTLNNNNNYSSLWNIRKIYNLNNFVLDKKYYLLDNSDSILIELPFNCIIHLLKKLNLIIKCNVPNLILDYLTNIYSIVNIVENYIFIDNQFSIKFDDMSEKEILQNIILHSKNYLIISDDSNIKNEFNNVLSKDEFLCKKNLTTFYFEKEVIEIKNNFIYGIKPFFIYFPQFHQILENDINFYDGYTDYTNLLDLNKDYKINNNKLSETPSLKELEISDYNLLDSNLLQKQIDILTYFNLPGFAMYYYWFDKNTITNKNMIFKDVIDMFFYKINMKGRKIFFIWTNENWSDTIALSNPANRHLITNSYSADSMFKNAMNLIEYFKNDSYLKIDNKPVFYIYHSWKISEENIKLFYSILNKLCIESGFDGIHFTLNTMFNDDESKFDEYNKFYLNINYKNNNLCKRYYSDEYNSFVIDYYKYINSGLHIKKNQVNTVFFNFDNHPRFYKPDKIKHATYCINNSELNKYLFTNNIIETYKDKTNENEKILLINAWNEWGENMVFEPSNEFGYYNLKLLLSIL